MKVEFFKHNIDSDDIIRVGKILESVFLTTGESVHIFERNMAGYVSNAEAVGVTSCTAALHLCLLAWGIGQGDEVITTPMSFCATSNTIIHAGATPVFVDVEKRTGNINADQIITKITKNTKAIMPVHLYGQMCDMKKIKSIADQYKLVVIEDAAHCIEGIRENVRVGQLGDAACFSFYATKNITSGEGGAITTNNPQKADLLRMLRLHGMDKSAADRYTKQYNHWDMPILGWKYNMDNIQAALLLGQLNRIENLWKRRDAIARIYEENLAGVEGLELMENIPDSKNARHLFTILVNSDKRDAILWYLQENGVGVAVNYRAIHLLGYYKRIYGYKEGDFPVAEEIGARTISLPLYPKLHEDEIEYVITTVKKAVEKFRGHNVR